MCLILRLTRAQTSFSVPTWDKKFVGPRISRVQSSRCVPEFFQCPSPHERSDLENARRWIHAAGLTIATIEPTGSLTRSDRISRSIQRSRSLQKRAAKKPRFARNHFQLPLPTKKLPRYMLTPHYTQKESAKTHCYEPGASRKCMASPGQSLSHPSPKTNAFSKTTSVGFFEIKARGGSKSFLAKVYLRTSNLRPSEERCFSRAASFFIRYPCAVPHVRFRAKIEFSTDRLANVGVPQWQQLKSQPRESPNFALLFPSIFQIVRIFGLFQKNACRLLVSPERAFFKLFDGEKCQTGEM